MINELTVTDDEADTRLDRYLKRHTPGLTQSMIQKLLRAGKIRVDGKRAEASTHLAAGALVKIPAIKPPEEMPKQRHVMVMDPHMVRDLEAMILYRDDSVIVLNKPAGLASQGGKGIAVHLDGMLDALRFGGTERPKLVHRLDRDTSGVLLLARGVKQASKLSAAFRGRDVEKTYWALLWGVPPVLEGRIDLPLALHPRRARRQGSQPRHHRIQTHRLCRQKIRLGGDEPAHRADASTSRACAGPGHADSGRCLVRRRLRGRLCPATASTRPKTQNSASRGRFSDGGGASAETHAG
jgi:23S rRNA-/tRNA-specific pseudouridylate synthase